MALQDHALTFWSRSGSECKQCFMIQTLTWCSINFKLVVPCIVIQCEYKSNRCNSMQILIHCKTTLHVSGVTAPIIRSIKNCTRSLRYRSYYLYRYSPPTWSDRDWFVRVDTHKPVPIRPRWRGVAVQVVWPVPETAGTVFNTPDDGCCDTRNM